MATFQTKANLPKSDQAEIDRILAIPSAQRNSVDAAFLVSLTPYLYNEVILRNEDDEIVIARGRTLPTGLSGFMKSALFIDSDVAAGTQALYENTGDNASASWNLVGSIGEADIANGAVTAEKLASALDLAGVALTSLALEEGTPVNAVASTGTLTLTGAIVPGSHAETVLTSDTTNVAEDEVVVIGAVTYRWRDTLAQAFDVKIGASAAASLDNLKAAINASGTPGTEYFAGTTAHPLVVATTNTDTTQKIVVRIPGTASNALATTTTASHLSWADTTLGGGTGASNPGVAAETVTVGGKTYSFVDVLSETNAPAAAVVNQVLFGADSAAALDNLKSAINATAGAGTTYSTGTTANANVTATTNSNTEQVVAAIVKGVAGDLIASTDTIGNGGWGAGTLAGGVDGTVGIANEVLVDGSYLYVALAANTIADANWRRISLGSVY